MSSHFGSSFLPSAPDPASSAGILSPSPFVLSTQVPYNISLSCGTHWPGSRGPSSVRSSPNLTNTMPGIPVQRETRAQVPSQAPDLSHSLLANGPMVDYHPHGQPSPYSQHPPFPSNDSEADPKEKQPPRPRASNAFILFRSDFLKRKLISRGQEARQHKLSIIAAKCWHKLTREEKRKWFLEAEREKKAHALKYADCQSQPRARARSRRESRTMASPGELEHLGRLADMAYQEIINDIPSQLARENITSPTTSTTTALASEPPTPPSRAKGTDLSTIDCYQEQGQSSRQPSFPSLVGEVGQLSLPQSYQLPQTASADDFSTFPDAGMFPTASGCVGTYYPATIARPASTPMCPTARSFSGRAARQLTTFPSELVLWDSASIDEQTSTYFAMFSPHDIGYSGLANA